MEAAQVAEIQTDVSPGLFVLADTFLTAVILSFSSWLAATPPHFFLYSVLPCLFLPSFR